MTSDAMRFILATCICWTVSSPHASQDAALIDPAVVFKSESALVLLDVTVRDRRAEALADLPREVFSVTEDGVPQQIALFSASDVPVAAGLVIDNSGSMLTRHAMVVAGVRAFADSRRASDDAFTVIFNEDVHFGLPDSVPFAHTPTLLLSTLARVPPGGKTALHDAVTAALTHLEASSLDKRVLVVLSDGDDNASRLTSQDMLTRAKQSNASIYSISTARVTSGMGNERLLRTLARVSGGVAYSPRSEQEVVAAFTTIAEHIRRGYRIGYVPTNGRRDGSYRRVGVSVRARGYGTLAVTVRDGYVAPSETPSQP